MTEILPAGLYEPERPPSVRVAHHALPVALPEVGGLDRVAREEHEDAALAEHATRSRGAGNRARPEQPDAYRTCFERDLDRIHHSRAFRRLAGKCQVYIAPSDDHLRTRLTHAIEVSQVAVSVARAVGLNCALTAAAANGHDCGHGPAGHASEGALSPYLPGGYHHAPYGADIVLAPLNLCVETLDAIRNHSWNRPAPLTPEGEVVAWADRIAYCCHDYEDAVDAGVIAPTDLPPEVAEVVGRSRPRQLHSFVTAMIETITSTGTVALREPEAGALDAFRDFNYERIYLRPVSLDQAGRVTKLIRDLVDYFIENPDHLPDDWRSPTPGTEAATREAVRFVSGMTDRFALRLAVERLGWDESALPRGV
ncbi:MAG: HD domain-containing protein [Actinobacteria bacterium]|nr:MAG: HD domain-containing protein [Actinomycetota bacterium]RIK07546.1 MAG: deoxyguanosinetriphosphate triphosphohydrolase [Acidobacteriota bacterium]